METALAIMIAGFILSCLSFVLFLYFFLFRYRTDFNGITQLSTILDARLSDEDSAEMLNDALDSFYHLGALAQNTNAILSDEDTFDALMTDFAGRIRKSMIGAVMGTASGDVKKLAHAERVLNEAMIEGAKKASPELGVLLEISGLDDELKENPELFGYIIQIAEKNGLLNMFRGSTVNQPSAEQQAMVHERLGVDF